MFEQMNISDMVSLLKRQLGVEIKKGTPRTLLEKAIIENEMLPERFINPTLGMREKIQAFIQEKSMSIQASCSKDCLNCNEATIIECTVENARYL